ncbi:MAG TPA: hypothetical protein VK636_12700 [Gemmatimonadaceae bacterium]|nr:hypothetical protein [Gemmatimonadaceae bacterium]
MFFRLFSIILTALSLSAGVAHVLELSAKLRMSAATYLSTQQLYRGWALTGVVQVAALMATVALAIRLRTTQGAFRLATGATGAIVASLVIFFTLTLPVNRVTRNWTVLPSNWEGMRRRWEFSHAVGAVCLLMALVLVVMASITPNE